MFKNLYHLGKNIPALNILITPLAIPATAKCGTEPILLIIENAFNRLLNVKNATEKFYLAALPSKKYDFPVSNSETQQRDSL